MKRLLVLIVVGLVVFVAIYRQRVFLRDPLATVMRDGVKQSDATVMINYTNDVLLQERNARGRKIYLVQNWNRLAGVPTAPLKCVNGMACMTDADRATMTAIAGRSGSMEAASMTNRHVAFLDEDGVRVEVELR